MISNTNIRVRYQETDQMGVVYYANYLAWFEVGRNEFFREVDFPYGRLEDKGVYLPVASASCNYKSPARYDDLITVSTKILKLTPARIIFNYRVFRESDGKELATGETSHAFVSERGNPISMKKHFPDLYERIQEYVS
ncbi:acyl-CoA thioesterase [Natranaerobius trueperi]|uniref:Thioesterase n=1 Tax=Natranaerobius trueperi TaxID=759412 RepID=A0A226C0B6_9FIRM|nr:thioesterase family protein [Natranaerobius trueperi]OWZ84693.1 thioesterase [Natranaerobius trueperi]